MTSYHTVNGRIRAESTGGARTGYLPDALGSVTATVQAGAVVNTYRYKPYGELLAKTGAAADPRFMWVGVWGYRSNSAQTTYVRRRTYDPRNAGWTSVDRIWPWQRAYCYGGDSPVSRLDMFGTYVIDPYCKEVIKDKHFSQLSTCLERFCIGLDDKLDDIVRCLAKNGYIDDIIATLQCMAAFCSGTTRVGCRDNCHPGSKQPCTIIVPVPFPGICRPVDVRYTFVTYLTDKTRCGETDCAYENDPSGALFLCTYHFAKKGGKAEHCLEGSNCDMEGPGKTIFHELMHLCGKCVFPPGDIAHNAQFNAAATCLKDLLSC